MDLRANLRRLLKKSKSHDNRQHSLNSATAEPHQSYLDAESLYETPSPAVSANNNNPVPGHHQHQHQEQPSVASNHNQQFQRPLPEKLQLRPSVTEKDSDTRPSSEEKSIHTPTDIDSQVAVSTHNQPPPTIHSVNLESQEPRHIPNFRQIDRPIVVVQQATPVTEDGEGPHASEQLNRISSPLRYAAADLPCLWSLSNCNPVAEIRSFLRGIWHTLPSSSLTLLNTDRVQPLHVRYRPRLHQPERRRLHLTLPLFSQTRSDSLQGLQTAITHINRPWPPSTTRRFRRSPCPARLHPNSRRQQTRLLHHSPSPHPSRNPNNRPPCRKERYG